MLNFNIFFNCKNPIIRRVNEFNKDLPLWIIHGENSWIISSYFKITSLRQSPSNICIKVFHLH